MKKDVELFEALLPIRIALTRLTELVDETSVLVGSEAYAALEGVLDEMGKRFARKSKAVGEASGAKA